MITLIAFNSKEFLLFPSCKVFIFLGDVHWARLEASALGGLIAACPTWKKERRRRRGRAQHHITVLLVE